jgi:uncharacterized protein YegJ (DUF2314 family)
MRFLSFALFLLVAIGISCSDHKATINITQRGFEMPIVIIPLGDETIEATSVTRGALELIGDFRNYDAFPDSIINDGYLMATGRVGDSVFLPPELIISEGNLLMDPEDVDLLAKADRDVYLYFFGPDADIRKQEAISKLISSVTRNKKAVIYDVASRQAFNPKTWREVRVAGFQKDPIQITDHIILHAYRDGEFCRIVSLGMAKLGLPELSISNVTCSDQASFGTILNGIAQTLLENPVMYSDTSILFDVSQIKNENIRSSFLPAGEGATGKAKIKFKENYHEGDNPHFQLELSFVDKDFATQQEEQLALAKDLLGILPDHISSTEHDEELLAASEHARERLPELKQMFSAGADFTGTILVKVPFAEDESGSNEWMWVEVTKWTDQEMEGILQNEPKYVGGLHVGSEVKFRETDIFDYILYKADGSMEGNETSEILERRMGDH